MVLASARSRFGSDIINVIHYQNAASLPFSRRRRLKCRIEVQPVGAIHESPEMVNIKVFG